MTAPSWRAACSGVADPIPTDDLAAVGPVEAIADLVDAESPEEKGVS